MEKPIKIIILFDKVEFIGIIQRGVLIQVIILYKGQKIISIISTDNEMQICQNSTFILD